MHKISIYKFLENKKSRELAKKLSWSIVSIDLSMLMDALPGEGLKVSRCVLTTLNWYDPFSCLIKSNLPTTIVWCVKSIRNTACQPISNAITFCNYWPSRVICSDKIRSTCCFYLRLPFAVTLILLGKDVLVHCVQLNCTKKTSRSCNRKDNYFLVRWETSEDRTRYSQWHWLSQSAGKSPSKQTRRW